MAITLAIRGDSLVPRTVAVPTQVAPFVVGADAVPSVVADAGTGVIGGTVIDVDKQAAAYRTVRYVGYGNIPDFTTGLSVLIRTVPRYTGNPSNNNLGGIFCFGGFANLYFLLNHNTTGTVRCLATSASFGTMINFTTASTWSATAGTAEDFVLTWDGTTTANAVKIYTGAGLLGEGTAAVASDYSASKGSLFSEFLPCNAWGQGLDGDSDLNEAVVWNEVINRASVLLDSGLGALDGSARGSFVASTPSDGLPASGGGRVVKSL